MVGKILILSKKVENTIYFPRKIFIKKFSFYFLNKKYKKMRLKIFLVNLNPQDAQIAFVLPIFTLLIFILISVILLFAHKKREEKQMKDIMVSQKKRRILEGKVSYSLFNRDGDFSLLAKEEKEGEMIFDHEFYLPASSEKEAISFAERLIECAASPRILEELIEDYFA